MTKLYFEPDGIWTLPGDQSKAATRADTPNPPAELAAWLNARRVPAKPIETDDLGEAEFAETFADAEPIPSAPAPKQNDNCPMCARTPRGAETLAKSGDVDRIADWIMEQDQRGVERLFEAIGARVGELRRA